MKTALRHVILRYLGACFSTPILSQALEPGCDITRCAKRNRSADEELASAVLKQFFQTFFEHIAGLQAGLARVIGAATQARNLEHVFDQRLRRACDR